MSNKELFLTGMEFCSTHTTCWGCPIHDKCEGAYDMLPLAFAYIRELTEENERLKAEKEQ